MNYSEDEFIKKLVYELNLHDANLIMVKLVDKELYFYVSCKGMGINYYYNEIEDIILEFHIKKINNISFEFGCNVMINDFCINKNDDLFVLKINDNDFYIECFDLKIKVSNIKKVNNNKFELLDKLLKSDI